VTPVLQFQLIPNKNPQSVCCAGLRRKIKMVRPKGLEPLLQAPEACVISTSPRARQEV
jgi:hypothetical protein